VPVTSGLGDAAALVVVVAGAEVAGADVEEDEEELQAAAVRPRQAMPSRAASRLFEDRKDRIPRR